MQGVTSARHESQCEWGVAFDEQNGAQTGWTVQQGASNDAADDVCTEVYLWPAAAASNDEEAAAGGSNDVDIRRLKIIAQATSFVGRKQRKHRGDSWGRLAASHAGGISFKVLGVRWTSAYFAALLVSSGASLLSGLARMYT